MCVCVCAARASEPYRVKHIANNKHIPRPKTTNGGPRQGNSRTSTSLFRAASHAFLCLHGAVKMLYILLSPFCPRTLTNLLLFVRRRVRSSGSYTTLSNLVVAACCARYNQRTPRVMTTRQQTSRPHSLTPCFQTRLHTHLLWQHSLSPILH